MESALPYYQQPAASAHYAHAAHGMHIDLSPEQQHQLYKAQRSRSANPPPPTQKTPPQQHHQHQQHNGGTPRSSKQVHPSPANDAGLWQTAQPHQQRNGHHVPPVSKSTGMSVSAPGASQQQQQQQQQQHRNGSGVGAVARHHSTHQPSPRQTTSHQQQQQQQQQQLMASSSAANTPQTAPLTLIELRQQKMAQKEQKKRHYQQPGHKTTWASTLPNSNANGVGGGGVGNGMYSSMVPFSPQQPAPPQPLPAHQRSGGGADSDSDDVPIAALRNATSRPRMGQMGTLRSVAKDGGSSSSDADIPIGQLRQRAETRALSIATTTNASESKSAQKTRKKKKKKKSAKTASNPSSAVNDENSANAAASNSDGNNNIDKDKDRDNDGDNGNDNDGDNDDEDSAEDADAESVEPSAVSDDDDKPIGLKIAQGVSTDEDIPLAAIASKPVTVIVTTANSGSDEDAPLASLAANQAKSAASNEDEPESPPSPQIIRRHAKAPLQSSDDDDDDEDAPLAIRGTTVGRLGVESLISSSSSSSDEEDARVLAAQMGSSSSDDDDTNTRLDDGVLSDGGFSYGYTDNDASSHFSGNAMSPPIISRAGSTRTSRHFASGQVTRSSSQRLLGGAPASRMPSTHSTNAISAAFAAAAAAISAQTSSITTTTASASLTTTTTTATTTTVPTVPVTPSTSAPPPAEPPKSPSGGGSAASRIASLPKVIKRMSLPRLRRSSTVNDSKSSKETAAIPDSPMPAWPPSIPQQQQQQLQQPLQRLPSVSASTSANGASLPVKSMPNSRAPSRAVSPTTMLQTAQQQQMPPLPPVPSEPSYQQLQQLQQSTGTLLEVPDSAVGITSPIMSPASAALPSVTSPGLSALSVYGAIPSSEVDNTLVANRIEDDDQREKVKQAIDRLHKLSTQPIDDMFAGLSSDSPVLTLGATTKTEKPSVSKLNRNKSINSASKLSRQPTLLAPVKKMSIRVYVEHLQRYHTVSVPVEGAAKHAISAMVDQNIIELDSEWTLFESIKQFGIERPLCDWEVIKGIMRQWDIAEGTVDLNRANSIHSAGGRPSTSSALTLGGPSSSHSGYQFIVKKYTNRPLLSLPDGVPARPPSIEGWLKYRNKKNKWEKEFFYLCGLELGFWKDQKKKDGQTLVLSLANHDLYIPSNRIKGAPNKHVFVLKSEEALSMFENPESDYIRVFAAPKAENLELWFSQLRMAKNLLWYQDRRSAEKKMSRNASGNADGAHLNIDIDIDDSGYITDGGADRVILDRDSISLSGVVVADTEDTQLRRMASQSRLKRNKSINVAASVPSTAIGADNLGSNSGAGGLGGSGLIQLAGGVQRTATLTRTKSQTRPGANGPTLLSLQQSTSSEGGVAAAAAVLRRGQTKAAAKKYAEGATKPGRDFLGLDIGGGGSDLQSEFFSAVTKRSGSINSNSASNNANAQQAIDPSTLLSLNFDFGPSTTVSSANATSGGLSRSKSVKNKPSSNSQQGGVFAPGSLLSQREEGEHSASVNPRPSTDRIGTDIASDLISTGGAHHRRRPSELNTGRSGPLVDLTAPSLFSQGSLLSRRERSGTVSNSQGNNPPTGALPRLPEDGPLLPSFSSQSASATPHQTATNASQQERVPNQPLLMADLRPEESHTQSLLHRSGTTRIKPLLNFEPGSYQSAPQSAPTAFPDASDE